MSPSPVEWTAHFSAMRDLIQILLTAAAGILVFSVTFAEKIGNFGRKAGSTKALLSKYSLGNAWALLLVGASCSVNGPTGTE
jgi:hypothetical protein